MNSYKKPFMPNPLDLFRVQIWALLIVEASKRSCATDDSPQLSNSGIDFLIAKTGNDHLPDFAARQQEDDITLVSSLMSSRNLLLSRTKLILDQPAILRIDNDRPDSVYSVLSEYHTSLNSLEISAPNSEIHESIRFIHTHDPLTGCGDLALSFLAKDLVDTYRVVIADDLSVINIRTTPDRSHLSPFTSCDSRKSKNCIVWLSHCNIDIDIDWFASFIIEVSKYYNVIMLPPSMDLRSNAYFEHIKFGSGLTREISLRAGFPTIIDLLSLPSSDEDLFISDVPAAGWIFGSIGVNSVYLAHKESEISEALASGYCQILRPPLDNHLSLLESIKPLEMSGHHISAQSMISKIYSHKILSELLAIMDSV
jgi:hypothetical protein